MKKKFIFIFLSFQLFSNAQNSLGKLYYNNNNNRNVEAQSDSRTQSSEDVIKYMRNAETTYLDNKSKLENMNLFILKELRLLKIDTLNIAFREGLNHYLEKIEYCIENKLYNSDYTVIIDDFKFEINKLMLLKEDEDYIIEQKIKLENQLKEQKLKLLVKENEELKNKLKIKKSTEK